MNYKNGWVLQGYGISLENLINKNVIDIRKFIDIHGFEDEGYESMKEFYDEYKVEIKNLVSDGGISIDCMYELTPYNIYYFIEDIKSWDNVNYKINNMEEAQQFIFNSIKIFLKDGVKLEDLADDFGEIAEGWED